MTKVHKNMSVVIGSFTNTLGEFKEIVQEHDGFFLYNNGVRQLRFADDLYGAVRKMCHIADGYSAVIKQMDKTTHNN